MSASPKEQFIYFLARSGRRLSEQVSHVADTALSAEGTFVPEEMVAILAGKASRATIYRTLAHLVDADLLRKVQFNGHEVLIATAPSADI